MYTPGNWIMEKRLMPETNYRTEEFQINGEEVIAKLKEILHEGNIRRITIKNEEGKSLIDIPLTFGVVGALLAPQLAAVGAIAALVNKMHSGCRKGRVIIGSFKKQVLYFRPINKRGITSCPRWL